MYSQGHRPSDLESMSSQTTDVTSRATTVSDSASDATLTMQQEKGPINIQRKEEEWDRSLTPTTNTASVNTVISKNSNGQRAYNNQTNAGNQQQQSWVNPYWGSNAKSNAAGLQSGTNKVQNNANNG
jgi:negative regulator of sigma E activity